MFKGDKRIALRIINGAIDLIKGGWTQGRSCEFDYATDTYKYCISGACGKVEDFLTDQVLYHGAKGDVHLIRRAAGRVSAELDRLAKRRGFSDRVLFNDSSKTTQSAVVRMMNSAKKNIERGADARASARSRSK